MIVTKGGTTDVRQRTIHPVSRPFGGLRRRRLPNALYSFYIAGIPRAAPDGIKRGEQANLDLKRQREDFSLGSLPDGV
jgi:hypothetical protein